MSRIADIGGAFCLVLLLEGTLSQAEPENVQVQFGSGWKIEHYTQSSKPFQIAQSPAQEWVNRAGDKLQQGDVKGAISDLDRAIGLDPNYYWAYMSRGAARFFRIGDLEGTIADTTRAIELDPSQYSPYSLRAIARYLLKDYHGAIADYDKVIELKPPGEFLYLTYFSRGDARRLAGDLEGAIADCTRSIELHASGEAYDNRGMAYADQGNFEQAVEDYKTAAEIFKQRGDRKNYQAAMERLQQALKRLQPSVQNSIPEPSSWLFPDVIESARAISPRNVEGRIFNQFGLAYSLEELEALPVATMTPQELQKYADVVTHAYPDAVFRQRLFASPISSCKEIPIDKMNTTSIANAAYISLHAIVPATRERAANCLRELQELWRDRKSAQ